MGIGSKVGLFPFFIFPLSVLITRYSLPVTVTSRFESLRHVMKGFKDVKESNSVWNLEMTIGLASCTVGYYAAFCGGGCRRVPRLPAVSVTSVREPAISAIYFVKTFKSD